MAVPLGDTWAFVLGGTNFSINFDYDGSGNQIYVGWAEPGANTADPVWRIMKQTFNGTNQVTNITWPNASTGFGFIWDNRVSLSYS